jgi:hypothetical protein
MMIDKHPNVKKPTGYMYLSCAHVADCVRYAAHNSIMHLCHDMQNFGLVWIWTHLVLLYVIPMIMVQTNAKGFCTNGRIIISQIAIVAMVLNPWNWLDLLGLENNKDE